jgi:hypothetical protein
MNTIEITPDDASIIGAHILDARHAIGLALGQMAFIEKNGCNRTPEEITGPLTVIALALTEIEAIVTHATDDASDEGSEAAK